MKSTHLTIPIVFVTVMLTTAVALPPPNVQAGIRSVVEAEQIVDLCSTPACYELTETYVTYVWSATVTMWLATPRVDAGPVHLDGNCGPNPYGPYCDYAPFYQNNILLVGPDAGSLARVEYAPLGADGEFYLEIEVNALIGGVLPDGVAATTGGAFTEAVIYDLTVEAYASIDGDETAIPFPLTIAEVTGTPASCAASGCTFSGNVFGPGCTGRVSAWLPTTQSCVLT